MLDSLRTFRLTRSTPMVAAVVSESRLMPFACPVRTISAPKLVPPERPLILPPARIGTSTSLSSPIRRLKNGRTSALVPGAKSKMSAPCRKKVRFSGKNSGNRVRLVRRVSTSVSAKSVLTVSDASAFAPISCVASRLTAASPTAAAPRPATLKPVTSEGRTLNPRPSAKSGRPVSRPARKVCVTL